MKEWFKKQKSLTRFDNGNCIKLNKFFLFVPLFLFIVNCFAQKSKLYDKCGQLIVDSTFQISKKQLKKFTAIEDAFTDTLGKRLIYSPVLRENEIDYEMFISFNIDDRGQYSDVKIEKASWHLDQQMPIDKSFTAFLTDQLMKSTGKFNENFKAKKGTKEKYYVPLKFKMNKKKMGSAEVVSGWLVRTDGEPLRDPARSYYGK